MIIFVSRRSVETEVLEKAGRIHEMRMKLSPAVSHLAKHDLFEANADFIDWDKELWELHDFLMRERARLLSGASPRTVLRRTRAAATGLEDKLQQVDQFKPRDWWKDIECNNA